MILFFIFCSTVVIILFIYKYLYEVVYFPEKLNKAKNAITEKNPERAIKILKRLRNRKYQSEIHFCFSQAYKQKKQYHLSFYHLDKIISEGEMYRSGELSTTSIHLEKAQLYEITENFEAAKNEYLSILSIEHQHLIANENLATILFNNKEYEKALTYLETIVNLGHGNVEIYEKISYIYYIQEDYSMSLKVMEKALNMFEVPNNEAPTLFYQYINILYKLQKYREILKQPELPNNYKKTTNIMLIKAMCCYNTKQFKKAFIEFDRSLVNYLEDVSDIVLQARYAFVDLLIRQKIFDRAISEMTLIKNANVDDFKDNELRLKLFTKIIKDKILSKWFVSSIDKKFQEAIFLKIKGFLSYFRFDQHTHRLSCFSVQLNTRIKKMEQENDKFVVFDFYHKSISSEMAIEIISNLLGSYSILDEKEMGAKYNKFSILIVSLIPISREVKAIFNQKFIESQYIDGESFLNILQSTESKFSFS